MKYDPNNIKHVKDALKSAIEMEDFDEAKMLREKIAELKKKLQN